MIGNNKGGEMPGLVETHQPTRIEKPESKREVPVRDLIRILTESIHDISLYSPELYEEVHEVLGKVDEEIRRIKSLSVVELLAIKNVLDCQTKSPHSNSLREKAVGLLHCAIEEDSLKAWEEALDGVMGTFRGNSSDQFNPRYRLLVTAIRGEIARHRK